MHFVVFYITLLPSVSCTLRFRHHASSSLASGELYVITSVTVTVLRGFCLLGMSDILSKALLAVEDSVNSYSGILSYATVKYQ